jgi:RNA polymerase sigma-70 factor (ECF subfamily)
MQAFVLRITRNHCLDKIRAQNRKLQNEEAFGTEIVESSENPHERTELRDTLSVVKQIIMTLPETQKTIITLRDIEGLEFEEISEITGMNENAIKVNLSRARKRIRTIFSSNNLKG